MSDMKKPVARSLPGREYSQMADSSGTLRAFNSSGQENGTGTLSNQPHCEVLDLRQAADVLHCHPKTLRLMAKANKIPALRVGRLWRFSEKRLREWLEAS